MKISAFIIFAALFLACGCVSRQTETIFGTKCKAISKEQQKHLISYARTALKKHAVKYKFSPQETMIITKEQPRLRFEYRGDCFGTMYVHWEAPTRKIGICFEGKLDLEMPFCAMMITPSDGTDFNTTPPDKTLRGR